MSFSHGLWPAEGTWHRSDRRPGPKEASGKHEERGN